MRRAIYLVLAILIVIVAVSCDSGGGTGYNCIRKVYEVSEENISGNGGYVNIPELEGIGDYSNMPLVIVYGDQKSAGLQWHPFDIYRYYVEEGRIYIDAFVADNDLYRIVIIK